MLSGVERLGRAKKWAVEIHGPVVTGLAMNWFCKPASMKRRLNGRAAGPLVKFVQLYGTHAAGLFGATLLYVGERLRGEPDFRTETGQRPPQQFEVSDTVCPGFHGAFQGKAARSYGIP